MKIDILYLGVNMGNSGHRFFYRYPEAEKDYYLTFKWLGRLKKEYPHLDIAVKHHPGPYNPDKDEKEINIIKSSNIRYINQQSNSYILASQAKMCVSYVSSMILELNGYPNLAYFIKKSRMRKREILRKPCPPEYIKKNMRYIVYPPSFYLDPYGRNRHFCRFIDEINKINCHNCAKRQDLEIYNPHRIYSYLQFKNKAKEILSINTT